MFLHANYISCWPHGMSFNVLQSMEALCCRGNILSNTIGHKTYVAFPIIHMQHDHNGPTNNSDIYLQNVNG